MMIIQCASLATWTFEGRSWNRNLASDCSLLTIYSHTCPNISSTLDKYILWFGQIRLVIWTNTSWGPTGAQTSSYTYIWWEEVFFFVREWRRRNWATAASHFHRTLQTLLTSLKHYKHYSHHWNITNTTNLHISYIACFLDALATLRRGVSWPRDSQPTQKAKK